MEKGNNLSYRSVFFNIVKNMKFNLSHDSFNEK